MSSILNRYLTNLTINAFRNSNYTSIKSAIRLLGGEINKLIKLFAQHSTAVIISETKLNLNTLLKQDEYKKKEIIDELGYFKLDKIESNLFFQIVNKKYETSSIIITTNLNFIKLKEVFNLTTAIL